MKSTIKSIALCVAAAVVCLVVATPLRATIITNNFDDGTEQGWVNVLTSNEPTGPTGYEASSRSDASATAQSPSYRVIPATGPTFSPLEDGAHDTLVFRSPEFVLGSAGSIDLYLHIGTGATNTPGPSFTSLPASSSNTDGFMGVALRRASDDAYVLSVRKSAGGWELLQFNNASLTANSLIGIPLTLDLIDQFNGGGGWIALDDVVINDVLIIPEPSTMLLFATGGLVLWRQRRK